MRPVTSSALHAIAAAVLTALAASSAAAASSDYFLKLGDVKGESAKGSERHKDQIEILSWSWGETRVAALTDGLMVIRTLNHPEPSSQAGKVEHEWKVEEGESAAPAPAPGGVRVAAGDVNGDGGAAEKFGAVGGMHRNEDITSPRDAASGQATGKRQHLPVRARTYASPLDRGSVRIKVKFPWLDCKVGSAFPDAVLQADAKRYELKDVVVSGCARDGVALNYAKVQVRGWDPKKKEE